MIRRNEATGIVQEIELGLLQPHPCNREIYGEEDVLELVEYIAESQWIKPLVISQDHRIISGLRRAHAVQGYIYPHLTIHAYMSRPKGQLLAVAVTETRALYLYAERYREDRSHVYEQRNASDGNSFLVVQWEPYQKAGHPLSTFVSEKIAWRSVS